MNVTGFLLCVTAIQTLTIVGMTIVQHLYNRLMCRNMTEYNNIKADEPKQPISRHKTVLNRWRKNDAKVGDE